MIRVVLVDDHRLVRAGLNGLLSATSDIEVVGEAADGAEALDVVRELRPDVVLMDISMPRVDGIAATKSITEELPEVNVVAVTTFVDDQRVLAMLESGAVGYVVKDTAPEELLAALRAAAQGHVPIDPRVAGALLRKRAKPVEVLSDREEQVLRLAARGLANKQIGRELGISERTVKVHLGNVFRRIGVADRTSAALWARDNLAPST